MSFFKVSLVCWQHGGRCVECLFGSEARDGGQRRPEDITASSHLPLCPRPRDLGARPRLRRGQAGRGYSNPRPGVKGQSSKHSVLQSHQRNDDWKYNLGCLPLTRPGNKKKAIETQSLKSLLKIFLTSVFQ